MSQHVEEIDNRLKRSKFALRTTHQDMNLVLGLHALLQLQYTHEGHLDAAVNELLEEKLHGIELQLADILGRLHVEDLPF